MVEEAIGELLLQRGWLLSTAESCTGGMIGARITAVPGSSGYYAGGVVAYSNAVKMGLLGVDAGLLQKHGAVSAPVAEAMAVGVLDVCGADVAVSTTGIAGPDGGSVQKPVGLVFIGLACRNRPTFSERFIFSGNRKDIRLAASQMALEMIQRVFDL